MKAFIWMAGIVLLSTTSVFAQQASGRGGDPAERKEKAMEKLTTELELTQEQQVEVSRILDEGHEKRKAMKEKSKAERQEAMKEHMQAMKEVLTEEQFEKYKAMAKERRQQMRQHRQEGGM